MSSYELNNMAKTPRQLTRPRGMTAPDLRVRVVMERTIAKQISPPEYWMYHFALCAAVSDLATSRTKNGKSEQEKIRHASGCKTHFGRLECPDGGL